MVEEQCLHFESAPKHLPNQNLRALTDSIYNTGANLAAPTALW